MNKKIIVIMQPYFLPYRNYFGLIKKADHFVIFDDVQFCRKWQHRNQILFGSTKEWITIPVMSKRPKYQLIKDVQIHNPRLWNSEIISKIKKSYKDHPYFDYTFHELEYILKTISKYLIEITVPTLLWATKKIGLRIPEFSWSSEYGRTDLGRTERLVHICTCLNATHYLVGTAAKSYLKENLFKSENIEVLWHEDKYFFYPQLNTKSFDHNISILDLIMNCGPNSFNFLESTNSEIHDKIRWK